MHGRSDRVRFREPHARARGRAGRHEHRAEAEFRALLEPALGLRRRAEPAGEPELAEGGAYKHIEALGKHLDSAFARHALKAQAQLPRIGPIVWPYFDTRAALPVAASSISGAAIEEYHRRYRGWLARGVYLPPSAYEVCFLSAAHTTADVDKLLDVLATSEKA